LPATQQPVDLCPAAGVVISLDHSSRKRPRSGNLHSLGNDRHVVRVTANPPAQQQDQPEHLPEDQVRQPQRHGSDRARASNAPDPPPIRQDSVRRVGFQNVAHARYQR
jgi:hypothetical protein